MSTRRRFLLQTGPLAFAPWLVTCGGSGVRAPDGSAAGASPAAAFRHGVASGDPLADRVVLWTRVTPPSAGPDVIEVEWSIARNAELSSPLATGQLQATADADYTVKVDAAGLAPGESYHYAFRVGNVASPVGKTRTLPEGHVERLRLAVTSCANYPQGFFHAYRKIAERADLDAVLYLGDYLYEYANRTYGDGFPLGRVPDPNRELSTLSDYRRRHAQYKTDPDLQEVHRLHPCIAVWDDHEFADNAYQSGAANHQPESEGSWQERKRSAARAYLEWMPVRAPGPERIYRRFAFGDLADLLMLDTRIAGRDRQVADTCDEEALAAPERSLLGEDQHAWLERELAASAARGARWRLIGQQVSFSGLRPDPARPECVAGADGWRGYAASRQRVLDAFESVGNAVVLSGDAHSSWGFDIAREPFDPSAYDPATGRGSVGVEIVVPGVSSPGTTDPSVAARDEQRSLSTHPHVKLTEQHSQGYAIVEVSHERTRAQWYYVSSVREPVGAERAGGAVETVSGRNSLGVVRPG